MIKKLLYILCFGFLMMITGCSSENTNITVEQPAENSVKKAAVNPEEKNGGKEGEDTDMAANSSIVVYFSREGEQYGVGVIEKGNTAILADIIAEEKNADMFRLYPKVDNYPTTYDALTDYAKKEQAENARPELLGTIDNWDDYDTVYLSEYDIIGTRRNKLSKLGVFETNCPYFYFSKTLAI